VQFLHRTSCNAFSTLCYFVANNQNYIIDSTRNHKWLLSLIMKYNFMDYLDGTTVSIERTWHQGLGTAYINTRDDLKEGKSRKFVETNSSIFFEKDSHWLRFLSAVCKSSSQEI